MQSGPVACVGGRAPIQFGAELFGSASTDADSEIVTLLLSTLERAQVQSPLTLDIGHIGIYDALFSYLALEAHIQPQIFDALQHKSAPHIELLADQSPP